jgi:hypothetical protein
LDDEQERRVRLLLLGKGAVLVHRFERPLAAEMDEVQQRDDAIGRVPGTAARRHKERCRRAAGADRWQREQQRVIYQ